MIMIKIIIYLFMSSILLSLLSSVESQRTFSKIGCNKEGRIKLDKTTRWFFFFGEPDLELPEDSKTLSKFCRDALRRESFIKSYAAKCLPVFPRQVTNLLLYGISKRNKYHCNTSKGNKEVQMLAKCGNKGKQAGNQCMTDLTDAFMAAINAKDTSLRIPLMCCNYYKFEECIESEASKIGEPFCPPTSVKLVEDTLYAYTGDLIRNICAKYSRESDICEKDILPFMPKKRSDQNKRPHSVLPAFIDVLESV